MLLLLSTEELARVLASDTVSTSAASALYSSKLSCEKNQLCYNSASAEEVVKSACTTKVSADLVNFLYVVVQQFHVNFCSSSESSGAIQQQQGHDED